MAFASVIFRYEDTPDSEEICFAGEVGLGGEIRAVHRIENRIAEAEKLGFKKIIVSKYAVKGLDLKKYKIEVMPVSKLEEVYQKIF